MNIDIITNFIKKHKYTVCIASIITYIFFASSVKYYTHKKGITTLSNILMQNDVSPFDETASKCNIKSSDLQKIYDSYIQNTYADFTNKKIDEDTYIKKLTKIEDLKDMKKDTLNSYLMKSDKYKNSDSNYNKALNKIESKNYEDAFKLLKSIPNEHIDTSSEIKKCTDMITSKISKQIKELCSSNKFDESERLLIKNKKYYSKKQYDNQLKEIHNGKNKFFDSLPVYSNSSYSLNDVSSLSSINEENINDFNITSGTKYVVYVNTKEQLTYVFCGQKNQWNVLKKFVCATGKPESETPKGFFRLGQRGDWFFSGKYGQGGKYWTSFRGTNYLFHSVPYDSSATVVVDKTLGKAVSHGCIRLSTEDSKFIHDNIPAGTSVIIN